MWKSMWIGIAFTLIAVSAEPAIDNEEIAGDIIEDVVVGEDENNNNYDDDIKNVDTNIPGFDKGLPTSEEFLEMIESMNLSDEEKANLQEAIMNNANMDQILGRAPPAAKPFFSQLVMLLGFLSIVAVIFVFFGYKLYKSLIDKERKREMKKKQKELKKRK